MEIHFFAGIDEFVEDHKWTAHLIGNVDIYPWFEDGETIYCEESEIMDQIEYLLTDQLIDLNDEESEAVIKKYYDEYVKEVIAIETYAGT